MRIAMGTNFADSVDTILRAGFFGILVQAFVLSGRRT